MRNITNRQQALLCIICRLTTQQGAACNLARVANVNGIDVRAAYARLNVLERRRMVIANRPGRAKAMTISTNGESCQKCGLEACPSIPVTGRNKP